MADGSYPVENGPRASPPDRLDGWKSIAAYLKRDRTTVIRWSRERGLPVHRFPGGRSGTVFALRHELDIWVLTPDTAIDIAPIAAEALSIGFAGDALPQADHPPAQAQPRDRPTDQNASAMLVEETKPKGWVARRSLIGGITFVAAAAAGTAILSFSRKQDVLSPADQLAERGGFAMRLQGERWAGQSVRYLEKAVEVDPKSARAWGGLALAYCLAMIEAQDTELQSLAARCRAAADRALALDPGNANAQIALANYQGTFRRWAAMEKDLTAVLVRVGEHPMPIAGLADVMLQVGRWSDALPQWDRLIAADPLIPVAHAQRARTLWSLGRIVEAEQALAQAERTLPLHPGILHAKFDLKLFSGRTPEAQRTLDEMAALGEGAPLPREIGQQLLSLANAPQSMPQEASLKILQASGAGSLPANVGARYLAAFGDAANAFRLLSCYYFGGRLPSGRLLPPPPQYGRRKTDELFFPTASRLRQHPDFARLTARLGLDAYWRLNRASKPL